MVALGLSAPAASALLAEAVALVGRLPATLAALEDGAIGPGQARLLAELLGPLPDDAARAAAIRDRSVRMCPGEDGMAALSATLPTPVAAACRAALRGYAAACRPPATRGPSSRRWSTAWST